MKIAVLSDLHLDRNGIGIIGDIAAFFRKRKVQVVLFGGDLLMSISPTDYFDILELLRRKSGASYLFYTLGNHDYRNKDISKFVEFLRKKSKEEKTILLENQEYKLGKLRIFGATLWSSFSITDHSWNEKMEFMKNRIECKTIFYRGKNLQPETFIRINRMTLSNIKRFSTKDGKKIVITHFPPSMLSIGNNWKDIDINFACNKLDDFIKKSDISLWCCGHIHEIKKYNIGNCHVFQNPLGNIDNIDKMIENSIIDSTLLKK